MKSLFLLLILVCLTSTLIVDARAQGQSESDSLKEFVIVYKPGSKWIKDKSVFEQNLKGHIAYVTKLTREGKMVAGGPFLDDKGGIAILRVKSEAEARTILKADPSLTTKVMTGELHPWKNVVPLLLEEDRMAQ